MKNYAIWSLTCLACALAMTACDESSDKTEPITVQTETGLKSISLSNCGNASTVFVSLNQKHDALTVNLEASSNKISIKPETLTYGPNDEFRTFEVKCVGEGTSSNVVTVKSDIDEPRQFFVQCSGNEITCLKQNQDCSNDATTCCETNTCCDNVTCGTQIDCTAYPSCLNYAECNSQNGCLADETAGIIIAPLAGLETSEDGDTATFQLKLNTKPTAKVVVTFTSSDDTEGVVANPIVTFTTENWDTPQTVTVRGQDDEDADGDVKYKITVKSVISDDKNYNNMAVAAVNVTNIDNEVSDCDPEMFVKTTNNVALENLELWETGVSKSFKINLGCRPTNDVTITLISSDETSLAVKSDPITFTKANYAIAQYVKVKGVYDGEVDGDKNVDLKFKIASDDIRYNSYAPAPLPVLVHDTDRTITDDAITLRLMAANITTGANQSYDDGEGIRIFQAMKPDIVMIQEFNMRKDTIDNLVITAFGNEYDYYRGSGDIPNGIISRYPILETGQWKSPAISNRGFNYAVIDIPGPKDLVAVSVHLSTETDKQTSEIPSLAKQIATVASNRYVALGGDFNTKNKSTCTGSELASIFKMDVANWPTDQNGNENTNSARANLYDWLLSDPELYDHEVPVVIGEHSYPHGHVFDSRVYAGRCKEHDGVNELDDVKPVQANDSAESNAMQHMAIIRDFSFAIK